MNEYDSVIPVASNAGFNNPTIVKALDIMSEWVNGNSGEFTQRDYLNKKADESISDSTDPSTTVKKINNQLSYIAVGKILKQMSERVFVVSGGDIEPNERALIKKAYIRFIELSGYRETWLDHTQMLRTGDQFITAGANPNYINNDKGFPFLIQKKSLTQLFFPEWATSLTNKGDNKEAKQFVEIVFDGEWDEAIQLYPFLLENGGTSGLIPANKDDRSLNSQNELQTGKESKRRTQVARFVDENKKLMLFFGGATAVEGQKLEGDSFPNVDRFGEITKNIFHKYCFHTSGGILNTGILQATHKLSVLDGMLQSIGYSYEVINLNAIKIIQTGMSPDTFRGEYNQALKDQLNLKEGVIYSRENINMQTTQAQSLLSEMFASLEQIIKNFSRLDIMIDDALTDPAKTLGALEMEQVAQTRGVRTLQKQNASEEQRFHDFVVDWIIENIDNDNPVELNGVSATIFDKKNKKQRQINGRTVQDELGEDVFVAFTVGDLREALAEGKVRIEIVPESGIKINEAVSRARAEHALNRYVSLGMNELAKNEMKRIKIMDGESESDLEMLEQAEVAPQQQQQAPQMPQAENIPL